MKCLRIYATPDGESHFDDIEIPMSLAAFFPGEPSFYLSSRFPAERVRFVRVPAGVTEARWHTAPERMLVVWLDGEVELETSDGETRRLPAGGLLFVEDTHGKGHVSRHPEEGQSVVLIAMPDGLG